jgi:hypothetical protein
MTVEMTAFKMLMGLPCAMLFLRPLLWLLPVIAVAIAVAGAVSVAAAAATAAAVAVAATGATRAPFPSTSRDHICSHLLPYNHHHCVGGCKSHCLPIPP